MTNSSRSSMDSDNAEHPHGRNPANRTPAEAMRHNPCFGIMGLMPNRHKTHAAGHSSRLEPRGCHAAGTIWFGTLFQGGIGGRIGSSVPCRTDAGILDSVRFENSAAYLASWIQKLENDPHMIVSAASYAQRSSDFIMGIAHKESLQECQISPEGMPLTWAREHGIDTRIPGFVHHDQDGDGVSTLMEWKHGTRPTDPAFPTAAQAILVAMNEVSQTHHGAPGLDRAHLRSSSAGRAASPCRARFGDAAKERTSSDLLGFARPFLPSSPWPPDTRLRMERIGCWTSRATCQKPRTTQAFPDLSDQTPGSDVIQDSDFPWEIAERFFDSQKISALRASGALRVNLFSFYQRSTSAA